MSLVGKNAVVTGSASGIGRASALRLAQDGADVAILDINEEGLKETALLVEAEGRKCLPIVLDLMDRDAVKNAFDKIKKEMGFIEILHNNAGGNMGIKAKRFPNSSAEHWDTFINLNLRSVADCTREVVNDMIERKCGRIINTSSEQAYRGGPGFTDYTAAKSGLLGFTRSLALELAPYQITVNAVCPGITRTPILEKLPPEHIKASIEQVPMKRIAEPHEIAHAVSFFASPGASFITGEHILVTGGRTIHF